MAIFLNKHGILKQFDRLFQEASKEIILITPFIKLSSEILDNFDLAQKKGIEILIVYKDEEKTTIEANKLKKYPNVTLLKHQQVHAKCYMNERSLIICSMNLYEHSIKNNREMGVLMNLETDDADEDDWNSLFGLDTVQMDNALEEINEIIRASEIVHKSEYAVKNKFKFQITRTYSTRIKELVDLVNVNSDNKHYKVIETEYGHEIVCHNYVENCDLALVVDPGFNMNELHYFFLRRIELRLKHPVKQIEKVRAQFGFKDEIERRYKYYKVYWPGKNAIFVYRDQQKFAEVWSKAQGIDSFKGLEKGCKLVLEDLKKIKEFVKIF